MTVLEFIASLVGSIAWPATICVVLWLLRTEISGLFTSGVKRLKAGPVEVEYWEQAAVVAEAIALTEISTTAEVDTELERVSRLVETVPGVAVSKAFAVVVRRLRAVAAAHDVPAAADASYLTLLVGLRQRQLVSPETEVAIKGLVALQELAARDDGAGRAVTIERAREYLALAQGVMLALSDL